MMLRQSPRRNQRNNKGIKVKHVAQICLLLGVGIWLLNYQVPRNEASSSSQQESIKISEKLPQYAKDIKLGRKDLQPRTTTREGTEEDEKPKEDQEEEESVPYENENKVVEDKWQDQENIQEEIELGENSLAEDSMENEGKEEENRNKERDNKVKTETKEEDNHKTDGKEKETILDDGVDKRRKDKEREEVNVEQDVKQDNIENEGENAEVEGNEYKHNEEKNDANENKSEETKEETRRKEEEISEDAQQKPTQDDLFTDKEVTQEEKKNDSERKGEEEESNGSKEQEEKKRELNMSRNITESEKISLDNLNGDGEDKTNSTNQINEFEETNSNSTLESTHGINPVQMPDNGIGEHDDSGPDYDSSRTTTTTRTTGAQMQYSTKKINTSYRKLDFNTTSSLTTENMEGLNGESNIASAENQKSDNDDTKTDEISASLDHDTSGGDLGSKNSSDISSSSNEEEVVPLNSNERGDHTVGDDQVDSSSTSLPQEEKDALTDLETLPESATEAANNVE